MNRIVLPLAAAAALLLAACQSPSTPGLKVIVGAKLIDGAGGPPVDYSVVVIDGSTIRAAGPQTHVPVPKDAQIVDGLGATLEPLEGGAIQAGKPANLVLKGKGTRTMREGQWVE